MDKDTLGDCWQIGLTGGIGCGKSAVGDYLVGLGLRRLDTDKVSREIVQPSSPALRQIVENFGPEILKSDGSLDRQALGEIVFSNPESRQRLEQIMHPAIRERVEGFLRDCRERNQHCVVESPLLFETQRQDAFNSLWVVSANPDLQSRRLAARNGWTQQEVQDRIDSQMPLSQKIKLADVVILNEGSLNDLKLQVEEAWSRLNDKKSVLS